MSKRGVAENLLRWYAAAARPLPWRATRDPYRVWVSEIMLQQTRVTAVLGHYRSFLARFPDVRSLARARESDVLAAWSGLGYYRRARALHAAARLLVREHDGELPRTSAELRALPGIGRYTAAAIASIACGERTAVVDGNVERVLARLDGTAGKRDFWARANELLPATGPGDFNQAMMELGATICLPGQPLCASCPLRRWCKTRGPGAAPRRAPRRRRRVALALARRHRAIFLVQRPASARLMPRMWELPEIAPNGAAPLLRLRHAITTTDYTVEVFAAARPPTAAGRWVQPARIRDLPLTGLTLKILRHLCDI
jgi:A/G-specific adenine glycosylase